MLIAQNETGLPANIGALVKGFDPSPVGFQGNQRMRGVSLFSQSEVKTNLALKIGGKAKGNRIFVGSGFKGPLSIQINGHNNLVWIGNNVRLPKSSILIRGNEGRVIVGHGVTCTSGASILCGQNDDAALASIIVGDGGMWAKDISLYSVDLHPIFDLTSGERVNAASGPIILEPQVWLGRRASVMKNVQIGAGTTVGMGAVVVKSLPRYVVAAGVPAKIIRTGAFWARNENDEAVAAARDLQAEFPPES
jgi:acetyltransferase-like isoleucine patch superfamily enzyme